MAMKNSPNNFKFNFRKKIKNKKSGFVLLFALIFMSVMFSIGIALDSLSYKQQILSSFVTQSQYAFYAADAAMECALYADQKETIVAYQSSAPSPAPRITCDNAPAYFFTAEHSGTQLTIYNRFRLDSGTRCAEVTIYKVDPDLIPSPPLTTYIFAQGYDVDCDTVFPAGTPSGKRFVSRGLQISY